MLEIEGKVNLKNFQAVFEEEDEKVLFIGIDDSMNENIEKPRTLEVLIKGLTPISLTFYQLLLQKRSSSMNHILK